MCVKERENEQSKAVAVVVARHEDAAVNKSSTAAAARASPLMRDSLYLSVVPALHLIRNAIISSRTYLREQKKKLRFLTGSSPQDFVFDCL